jgi:hypothetical protein
MLTLVAAVLAYDIALETCDLLSSMVDAEDVPRAFWLSLKERSWTRLEKDMVVVLERELGFGN